MLDATKQVAYPAKEGRFPSPPTNSFFRQGAKSGKATNALPNEHLNQNSPDQRYTCFPDKTLKPRGLVLPCWPLMISALIQIKYII